MRRRKLERHVLLLEQGQKAAMRARGWEEREPAWTQLPAVSYSLCGSWQVA